VSDISCDYPHPHMFDRRANFLGIMAACSFPIPHRSSMSPLFLHLTMHTLCKPHPLSQPPHIHIPSFIHNPSMPPYHNLVKLAHLLGNRRFSLGIIYPLLLFLLVLFATVTPPVLYRLSVLVCLCARELLLCDVKNSACVSFRQCNGGTVEMAAAKVRG